jgi:hypothetical protein
MNNVNLNQSLPASLTAKQMQAQMNNRYAQALALGDPRQAVKQYDRPGMSRGGMHWNQAGIDAARSMADGVADAYSNDLNNRTYNSDLLLRGQNQQETAAQNYGALQQQNNYANQMAQLQRQQMGMNFASSLLGGLLR